MEKFELEYIIKSSPAILFNYLSTPDGLSQWFADNVNIDGNKYHFYWDGSEEVATLISSKKEEFIKFKWDNDEDDKKYFEFKLEKADMSGDLALLITDFCEDEDEKEEMKNLWDSQIENLMRNLGC
jgi:uncharacterized protein YndB with AHSA1/START domain